MQWFAKKKGRVMQVKLIRNATILVEYGGKKILVDPWLTSKGKGGNFRMLGFADEAPTPDSIDVAMPICELPCQISDVLADVDFYILTHIHPDHIDMEQDGTVGKLLNKSIPIFTQSDIDAQVLKKSGFTDVRVMIEKSEFENLQIIKTCARHGSKIPMGNACGFVLASDTENTLYVAGDTIWYDEIGQILKKYKPSTIVLNACAATFKTFGRLIMDDADVEKVCQASPSADIIVVHMDNVAHALLTRDTLRQKLSKRGILDKVIIPDDGEKIKLK